MNLKFLTFALASGMAAAHPHPPHPNCTVGEDTNACTLLDGGAGMFLCRPEHGGPPHGGPPPREDGIGGTMLRVVDRLMGPPPPPPEDHMMHDHGHHPHHDGPGHRQLRHSGSSSSSSSSSSSTRSWGPPMGRHGHGPHDGPGHHDHHHGGGGKGPHGGGGGKGPHHGPHGGGDHHGPHGRGGHGHHHGPPPGGMLSRTMCIPADGPPKDDHPFPPPPPFNKDHKPTCGCCGDVCPEKLDCGCTCDLPKDDFHHFEENLDKDGKGVWVTVTLRDDKTTVKKCVPAGAYADANRVQCVKECSAEMEEDELPMDMILQEERFGDEDLEKESRD